MTSKLVYFDFGKRELAYVTLQPPFVVQINLWDIAQYQERKFYSLVKKNAAQTL